jgi:glycosyltransferase involved in cell wall biosynthesis
MPFSDALWLVVPHRLGRAPSQRYRCEQYAPALEAAGLTLHWLPLLDEADDQLFYGRATPAAKAALLLRLWHRRRRQLCHIPDGSRVLVHREAFPVGGPFFERQLKRRGCRLIYDFDDTLWLRDVSPANRRWAWLKRPEKTYELFRLANLILAGNEYLAEEARRFSAEVRVMPTTVDTDLYRLNQPRPADPYRPVVIGWSGSPTTVGHFLHAVPALEEVKRIFGDRVQFQLIGDARVSISSLNLKGEAWSVEAELAALARFDIGLMPLPDTPWTRGKCGLKALTYLAFETPAVVSPVGVNRQIIRPNENGFWAATPTEWVEALSTLIENPDLRLRLGRQGRADVESAWSTTAWADRYVDWIVEV